MKALDYCRAGRKVLLVSKVAMRRVFYPKEEDNYLTGFDPEQFDVIYGSPHLSSELKH